MCLCVPVHVCMRVCNCRDTLSLFQTIRLSTCTCTIPVLMPISFSIYTCAYIPVTGEHYLNCSGINYYSVYTLYTMYIGVVNFGPG